MKTDIDGFRFDQIVQYSKNHSIRIGFSQKTLFHMHTDWRMYQQEAADFFRKLGLSAKVEHEAEGARGIHNLDVYVEGTFHGIPFKWVVECKAWNTAVPKEKVMALSSIVQDVGADRGFLLSETGFQSGAVRVAKKTNITLSSLEDLVAATEDSFLNASIGSLNWRLHKAQNRLREIKRAKYNDDYMPPTMVPGARLMVLESALDDALKGEYPIVYGFHSEKQNAANSLDELLKVADEIISEVEQWNPPPEV